MSNPVNIFISYTHADEAYKNNLIKHFVTLERNKKVKTWSDTNIEAGIELWDSIDSAFNQSEIFLPLISIDYLTSKSCISGELVKALSRRKQGEKFRVIPVILRPCDWHQFEQLGTYKALPHDGRPINKFDCPDEPYCQIVKAVSDILEKGSSVDLGEAIIPENEFTLKLLYNILSSEEKTEEKGLCIIHKNTTALPIISFSFPHSPSKTTYLTPLDCTETKIKISTQELIKMNWLSSEQHKEEKQNSTLIQHQLNQSINHELNIEKIKKTIDERNIDAFFEKTMTIGECLV